MIFNNFFLPCMTFFPSKTLSLKQLILINLNAHGWINMVADFLKFKFYSTKYSYIQLYNLHKDTFFLLNSQYKDILTI